MLAPPLGDPLSGGFECKRLGNCRDFLPIYLGNDTRYGHSSKEIRPKVQKRAKNSNSLSLKKLPYKRTFITIKFTYFEIQTITGGGHDRGIQNYT